MGLMKWFAGAVKRMFRKPFFIIFLLLIPLAMSGIRMLESDDDGSVKAVLYAEGSSASQSEGKAWNEAVINSLLADSATICFVRVDSEEELRRMVAAGDAECGYIFSENLMADLKRQRAKRDIRTVVSEGTFMDGIINEKVFAGVFAKYAADYLHEYEPEADELYREYLTNGSTFNFEYETVDGGVLPEKAAKVGFPVRGLGALFIWIMSLAAAVLAATDIQTGVFRGISLSGGLIRSYITIFAMTLVSGIVVLAMLIAGGSFEILDIVKVLVYCIGTAAYSMIPVLLLKAPVRVAALIPVAATAGMICCPIFADLAVFVPVVRYVRAVLPVWYMI